MPADAAATPAPAPTPTPTPAPADAAPTSAPTSAPVVVGRAGLGGGPGGGAVGRGRGHLVVGACLGAPAEQQPQESDGHLAWRAAEQLVQQRGARRARLDERQQLRQCSPHPLGRLRLLRLSLRLRFRLHLRSRPRPMSHGGGRGGGARGRTPAAARRVVAPHGRRRRRERREPRPRVRRCEELAERGLEQLGGRPTEPQSGDGTGTKRQRLGLACLQPCLQPPHERRHKVSVQRPGVHAQLLHEWEGHWHGQQRHRELRHPHDHIVVPLRRRIGRVAARPVAAGAAEGLQCADEGVHLVPQQCLAAPRRIGPHVGQQLVDLLAGGPTRQIAHKLRAPRLDPVALVLEHRVNHRDRVCALEQRERAAEQRRPRRGQQHAWLLRKRCEASGPSGPLEREVPLAHAPQHGSGRRGGRGELLAGERGVEPGPRVVVCNHSDVHTHSTCLREPRCVREGDNSRRRERRGPRCARCAGHFHGFLRGLSVPFLPSPQAFKVRGAWSAIL
jgi:hypothetical protein